MVWCESNRSSCGMLVLSNAAVVTKSNNRRNSTFYSFFILSLHGENKPIISFLSCIVPTMRETVKKDLKTNELDKDMLYDRMS